MREVEILWNISFILLNIYTRVRVCVYIYEHLYVYEYLLTLFFFSRSPPSYTVYFFLLLCTHSGDQDRGRCFNLFIKFNRAAKFFAIIEI